MEYNLRRKFIVFTVGAILLVLVLITGTINLSNYVQIDERAEEIVKMLSKNDGKFPTGIYYNKNFFIKITPELQYSVRYFVVRTDNNDKITKVDFNKISLSVNEAKKMYRKVGDLKSIGYIDKFKYLITNTDYGKIAIFLDCSGEMEVFYLFIQTSLTVCLVVLLMTFIVAFIFSKNVVAPIVESYEKQKQFITDASHELKTPLAIIATSTEVLEIETGENKWTGSIKNQVTRLNELIGYLVSLTRLDEEEKVLIKTKFNLNHLVTGVIDEFSDLATKNNKNIVYNSKRMIMYNGNEQMIKQLMVILIDNAIKYAKENTDINIFLGIERKKIVFKISNEADNLEIKKYDKLFERFYREDSSRNSKTGGYGIGLSIAREIVNKHKGKIMAESLDGKTMVFTVTL